MAYAEIVPVVKKLVKDFGNRAVFTRFVRDLTSPGHWPGLRPVAVVPRHTRRCGLEPDLRRAAEIPVVDEPTSPSGVRRWRTSSARRRWCCAVSPPNAVCWRRPTARDAGRQVTVVSGCLRSERPACLHEQALAIMDTNAPLISVTALAQSCERTRCSRVASCVTRIATLCDEGGHSMKPGEDVDVPWRYVRRRRRESVRHGRIRRAARPWRPAALRTGRARNGRS